MSTADPIAYTVVADDSRGESPSTQELRQGLEKGSDDVKLETLRKIVVSTLNGSPHVSRCRSPRIAVVVRRWRTGWTG